MQDPFLGFDLLPHTVLGVPIFTHAMSYLECELTCHMDVEGDHDIFVGKVISVVTPQPHVHVRDNGMRY